MTIANKPDLKDLEITALKEDNQRLNDAIKKLWNELDVLKAKSEQFEKESELRLQNGNHTQDYGKNESRESNVVFVSILYTTVNKLDWFLC